MGRRALASIILILICIVVFLFILNWFSSRMNMKPATLLVIALLFVAVIKEKRQPTKTVVKKEEGVNSFFFLLSFYRNIYMYLFDEHGEYKKEENKKTSNKFYI